MSGWGATDSDESKPKWLTADQKEDVFANSSGWVVKAGSTMTGNGNTSATPEVLVALGSLATSLGQATIDAVDFVSTGFDVSDGGTIIINVHYKADQVIEFLLKLNNPKIKISDESDAILDTGGGVKKAMGLIKADESIVINSDVIWNNIQIDSLKKMKNQFDQNFCDSLLCLAPIEKTHGYKGFLLIL